MVAQSENATQLEWYTGEIKEILTVGMRFDCIKFADDDEAGGVQFDETRRSLFIHSPCQAAVKLFYTMAHEQEANKLRTTSVEHKIKLVRAYVAKVPGGQMKDCPSHVFIVAGPQSHLSGRRERDGGCFGQVATVNNPQLGQSDCSVKRAGLDQAEGEA